MINTNLIENTHTVHNVSHSEAKWIHQNGFWIKWNREENFAFIVNEQYYEVLELRKWWKWKVKQKDFKRIRFIRLEDS